jgi:hypothetical protein
MILISATVAICSLMTGVAMSCLWWVLRLKFVASISFKQITDFLPDLPDQSVVNVKLDDGCIEFQDKKRRRCRDVMCKKLSPCAQARRPLGQTL